MGLSSSRSFELGLRHAERARERAALAASPSTSFGIAQIDRRRHAGGQQQAVAVEDAAAAGRQFERVGEAHLALLQEEVGGDDLHVGGAPEQQREAEAHERDEQLARHSGVLVASSGLVA